MDQSASEYSNLSLVRTLNHHSLVCTALFSNHSKVIATGCNHAAHLFDAATARCSRVGSLVVSAPGGWGTYYSGDTADQMLACHTERDLYVRTVAFSPNDALLVTGAEDRMLRLWDLKNKKAMEGWVAHSQDVYSVAFMPNGKELLSASADNTIKVWDVGTCSVLRVLGKPVPLDCSGHGVTSVAPVPRTALAVSGALDACARVWDTATGRLVQELGEHAEPVYSVAVSPDGRTIATASFDNTVKLWDTARLDRSRLTLSGHKDYVLAVAFSPDSSWVASGSKDRTVQFWDAQTGRPHLMLQGHKNSVISVGFAHGSTRASGMFVTAGGDERVRVWRYTPAESQDAPK